MAENRPSERPSLFKQGEGVVSDVRGAVLSAARHFEALAELFMLELREYGQSQARRLVALLVGAVLLLSAYVMLCIFAVVLLWPVLGLDWAMGAVLAFNVVAGVVALLVAAACKPKGLAPATSQEIKDDIQCIKLYLKEKENS